MEARHVVVIDDCEFFRQGLAHWLERDLGARVTFEPADNASVIVLGVSAKPTSGHLEDLGCGDVPVVLLVDSSSTSWILGALDIARVKGVLHRTVPARVLRDAMLAVFDGARYIDRDVIPLFAEGNALRLRRCGLTRRELEVLEVLGENLANKQIAQR